MEGLRREQGKTWRVLEFYSGIGGMRYSLMKAGVDAEVVEAFDINDVANDVYEHNFGHRPYQGNIQTLTAVDLDNYEADVWLLSPPCQPYTRQGHQKGSSDARASSFLKILELIPQSSRPPIMLFVENVVGFETSDTHKKMIAILRENHFDMQEFILSPLQFGVPYSRPRYFCLAKRKHVPFQNSIFNNKLLCTPGPVLGCPESTVTSEEADSQTYWDKLLEKCQPIKDFLELKNFTGDVTSESGTILSTVSQSSKVIEEGNGSVDNPLHQYLVPSSLIERWGSAMDIVFPESRRCCCFTKSYFRYVKGTGSLLATVPGKMKDKMSSVHGLHLRYFTPRELRFAGKQFECRSGGSSNLLLIYSSIIIALMRSPIMQMHLNLVHGHHNSTGKASRLIIALQSSFYWKFSMSTWQEILTGMLLEVWMLDKWSYQL